MKIYKNTHIFVLLGLISFLSMFGSAIAAPDACDSILSGGIKDITKSSDVRTQYNVAFNAHCASTAKSNKSEYGLGYEELSFTGGSSKKISEKFCKSSFTQSQSDRDIKLFISKINQGIVNAWSGCMRDRKPSGLSHYISVKSDTTFVYGMEYTALGSKDAVASIQSWNMSGNIRCEGEAPTRITNGGFEIICHRNKEDLVVVVAKADYGSKYLKSISLPGIEPYIPPIVFPRNCNNINKRHGSKFYTIDPDGSNYGVEPFEVYCEMSTYGGGWTLFAHHADGINSKVSKPVSPENGKYGVLSNVQWIALRDGMQDGMMFIDEHNRKTRVGVNKLKSAGCRNISQVTTLLGIQSLIHNENRGCGNGGGDYSLIHLAGNSYGNYGIAGAALYQQSSGFKFDIWPYPKSYSYEHQNTLRYFLR